MEQYEKWLKRIEETFLRYGIKSVTMDDISRELGISKKTLYQWVANKEDLVERVLTYFMQQEREQCEERRQKAANAVEEIFLVLEASTRRMQLMKANVVYDLQKYHRETWEKLRDYQKGFLYGVVRANLERGIQEGLYRKDLNVDITARLHIATIFQLFDEDLFPRTLYSKQELFHHYLKHYLHGIASEQGLKLLKGLQAHHL
ncbi:MAG: TetR/AcrR family transcriptional regulator [Saprospiraceae bacterium]|nr:TetR/AcrR family transcriptional regulator [Saprospiraceae bacterium]MDW8230305.1 TetR/AcrR family transcriptional regulator [Saprospiraceae bacterium]